MTKKKIIIIGWSIVALLILIPIGIRFYHYQVDLYYYHHINGVDPVRTIKESIGVELPESAEIVQYQYDKIYGDYEVKVKIAQEDIADLQEELLAFFEYEYTDRLLEDDIPDYGSHVEWWSIPYSEVENAYRHGTDCHRPRGSCWNWDKWTTSCPNWAFITKDDMGTQYLYISSNLTLEKYVDKGPSRYELLDEE